jgi:stearoyl-CoA desaturase (delta-9 desaturase)
VSASPFSTELPTPEAVEPVPHETLDRIANATVAVVPFGLLGWAATRAWGGVLRWQDLVVLGIMYPLTGFGITVGYHRLFTHRSFKTTRGIRVALAILGSAAVEGPVIEWVATHRRHHQHSDQPGDPHSPHVGHGDGISGALRGLLHAHIGWTVRGVERASEEHYAKDLIADRAIRWVSATFPIWLLAGLGMSFGLGVALTGEVTGGLTALLWGGGVRIFLLHHVTFSINSLCHFFGRRRFDTGDESRNLAWLAPFSMGESWHNNHHAFPSSAAHGMRPWELDLGAIVIRSLERLGLAWDVVRITPERQADKLVAQTR